MCGFIAQLVEQRTGNAEVTGSNPVEALIFFSCFFFPIALIGKFTVMIILHSHIFLSFLGSPLKQCILFKIVLQFSLPRPYTKLKREKIMDTRVQHCL